MTRYDSNEDRDMHIGDLETDVRNIHAHLEQVPLESGVGGGEALALYEIIDGQLLPPRDINGIVYNDNETTLIIDDPTVASTARGDGMGRARNIATGAFIMVVHDTSAPYGQQTAHRESDYGIIVASRSVTVGEDTTTYHYVARF